MEKIYSKSAAATFVLNKTESIHNWYPYLEGYSSIMVDDIVNQIGINNINTIYDPFCGTGTTTLVASSHNIKSYYSETNPFMQQVIEAKINSVKRLRDSGKGSQYLSEFIKQIDNYNYQLHFEEQYWDGFEKYFENGILLQLKDLKNEIKNIKDNDSRNIALVLLASIIVKSSKMIRRGDLRFAKDNEKNDSDKNVLSNYIDKLKIAISDIDSNICKTLKNTTCLSDDARDINIENEIDCVITSPPYLNGTNYIRNTKLELKLFDYLETEKQLPTFHSKGIVAGINNVSKRNIKYEIIEDILPYLKKLEPIAYDKRIPIMVASYFYDMSIVIERLSIALKNNGYFIMDIGDSQFAGIHIPTHKILTNICTKCGFSLYNEEILRSRYSKNGMLLSQRLLKFRLHKKQSKDNISFLSEAKSFMQIMPYKIKPYASRNWGHPWHSICSYYGKLKPSIAHFLIKNFTKPNDVVVDPLSGVGTIPLEACLQGRIGIGNDLSELAFCVTKAKIEKSNLNECLNIISDLQKYIETNKESNIIKLQIQKYSNFGFNGKLINYFHEETFKEIMCARNYFSQKIKLFSSNEAMVFSCLLHILHGNRPYALSRNSHPLTPYTPTGDFIYKNVIDHIKNKLILTYKKYNFENYVNGKAIFGDYKNLTDYNIYADVIISSPPFADSIRFYMQNWMRLWLCGWEEIDYKNADKIFIDQKQIKDFDIYISFFKMCFNILKPNGKLILHVGKTKKVDMAEELSKRAYPYFTEIFRGEENVEKIEKHGIKDKSSTIEHQYIFFIKK